jgi:mevalonate kinase
MDALGNVLSTWQANASGKVILLGEHAVVYGRPALAVPVDQVQATAAITPLAPPQTPQRLDAAIWIEARDLRRRYRLSDASPTDPIAAAIHLTLTQYASSGHAASPPAFALVLRSTIPIGSGLGSGAAVCTAIVRALGAYLGLALSNADVSALVYETEKLLHGTPSGIDNTVIAYAQPVYFIRGQTPVPFKAAAPFTLVIGDTGLSKPTRLVVGDIRQAYQREPARYTALFDSIGQIVKQAYALIEGGEPQRLGPLMDQNHALLQEIGVSCPELDTLVACAREAGALGAKLSGGGRGGNMIALVTPDTAARVAAALEANGAKRVIVTKVGNL